MYQINGTGLEVSLSARKGYNQRSFKQENAGRSGITSTRELGRDADVGGLGRRSCVVQLIGLVP